jgi:hypothetical protein
MSGEQDARNTGAGVEVNPDPKNDVLTLTCDRESFRRLRELLLADVGWTNSADRFHVIVIEHGLGTRKTSNWARDRIALIGCAAVAFALLFTLSIGVMTIIGWF